MLSQTSRPIKDPAKKRMREIQKAVDAEENNDGDDADGEDDEAKSTKKPKKSSTFTKPVKKTKSVVSRKDADNFIPYFSADLHSEMGWEIDWLKLINQISLSVCPWTVAVAVRQRRSTRRHRRRSSTLWPTSTTISTPNRRTSSSGIVRRRSLSDVVAMTRATRWSSLTMDDVWAPVWRRAGTVSWSTVHRKN